MREHRYIDVVLCSIEHRCQSPCTPILLAAVCTRYGMLLILLPAILVFGPAILMVLLYKNDGDDERDRRLEVVKLNALLRWPFFFPAVPATVLGS